MLRVMVADDEYFARKALVMMLKKMEDSVLVCGDCENGQEVLKQLEICRPDLIITDIRMPAMDGLKLAEYIQKYESGIDIIIETGYADFGYARQAIRYGVKEYLIKPLEERELQECIWKIIGERLRRDREESLRLLDFSYVLQNERLRRQILGWSDAAAEQRQYYMVLVNGKERLKCISFLEKWLNRYGDFGAVWSFFFQARNECILLAFSDREVDLQASFRKIAELELEKKIPEKIWVSFSAFHRGERELEKAYRECIYGINGRILKEGRIFYYGQEDDFREIMTNEQEQRLRDAVERGAEKEALRIIADIFERVQKNDENIYSFFAALMRILFVLNHVFYQEGENRKETASGYLLFDFKMDLYQFYDIESVRKYVEMLVKDICRKSPEENSPIIENLLAYLERNYSCEISLGDLAEKKYFVSSSYLSRLFKTYTGQTFSKYLIGLRMEKAKEFLEGSLMEISDIASYTGYNDPSHFAQTFRKTYGISPKEYRKRANALATQCP